MKIIFEDQDYIDALTPFKNGCGFKLIVEKNKIKMDVGCYLLMNLLTGAELEFYKMWKNNNKQPFEIYISPELKAKLLTIKPCEGCNGTIFKENV